MVGNERYLPTGEFMLTRSERTSFLLCLNLSGDAGDHAVPGEQFQSYVRFAAAGGVPHSAERRFRSVIDARAGRVGADGVQAPPDHAPPWRFARSAARRTRPTACSALRPRP